MNRLTGLSQLARPGVVQRTEPGGKRAIARSPARRDTAERRPDALLERGAASIHRNGAERPQLATDIGPQRRARRMATGAGSPRHSRAEAAFEPYRQPTLGKRDRRAGCIEFDTIQRPAA
jgi:hypothetical protein